MQDLLGDGLAGVHSQGAAAGGLAWRAQAAQLLAQAVGCAQDEVLECVDRGGACRGCLAAGGQQDAQRLASAVSAWLGELAGGQGVTRGPGRIGWVGFAAGPFAGSWWPVVVENSATVCDLQLQAVCWYSWMRPPRTVRRWIRAVGAGKAITQGSSFGARRPIPWP